MLQTNFFSIIIRRGYHAASRGLLAIADVFL